MPLVVAFLNLHNFGRNKSLMSIFLKPHPSTFATNLCYCLQAFFSGSSSLSYNLNCPQASACWINTSVQRPPLLSSVMLQVWYAVLEIFISVASISWGAVCYWLGLITVCKELAWQSSSLKSPILGAQGPYSKLALCVKIGFRRIVSWVTWEITLQTQPRGNRINSAKLRLRWGFFYLHG